MLFFQNVKVHINPTQFLAQSKDHGKLPEKIFDSFSFRPLEITKIWRLKHHTGFFKKKSRTCSLTSIRPGNAERSSAKNRIYSPKLANF